VVIHQESPIQGNQFELTKYHGEKFAAVLQKNVLAAKDTDHDSKRKKTKAQLACNYFIGLAKLNPAQAHVYYLNAAETFYSIARFEDSAQYYEKAGQLARTAGDQKIFGAAQKGLMAVLAQKNISKVFRINI